MKMCIYMPSPKRKGAYMRAVHVLDRIRATGGIDFYNLTAFVNEPRAWGAQ